MKLILTILLLIGGTENFTGNVSEFNKVKRDAEFAFNDEDYQKAVEKYTYLIDSLRYDDDNARLNLAHSYYHMDEIEKAKNLYMGLSDSDNKEIKSIANQQLGVFESRGKNLQKSLDFFKKSLMANPQNEESRYNYELVKKKFDEQQKNQDQNQDKKQDQQDKKDQEKQDKENKENKDKKDQKDQEQNKDQEKDQKQKSEEQKKKEEEQNKKDQQEQKEQEQKDKEKEEQKEPKPEEGEEQKPEEMKEQPKPGEPDFEEKEISKEMAEMILQAMRNKELQYLQQLKRKPQKPVDKDKPDW